MNRRERRLRSMFMLAVCATLATLSASGARAEAPPTAASGLTPAPASASTGQAKITPPGFLDTTDHRVKETRPAPTATELGALKELTSEVTRFQKIGGSYRDTLDALLRREYLRKRYAKDQNSARQVEAEEALEDKARLAAIALFERFIGKY